jgi:hypothetical protein
MGNIQEATDTKSESSVEHDMNSSSTSEAGQLPSDPIDKKHSEISRSESINFINTHRVITKGSSQKALMNEGRELLHILIRLINAAILLPAGESCPNG